MPSTTSTAHGGEAPGGDETAAAGEADAIARTAIASRQRVQSSVSVFCWARTLS